MEIKAVHPNTLRAYLKARAFIPARSWKSGQIKGYTCWLSGFRVRADRFDTRVWYQHDGAYRREEAEQHAQRYFEALRAEFECYVNNAAEVVVIRRLNA